MDASFVHRFWKSKLIPRAEDVVIPSVILAPRSFEPSDIGETNPYVAEVLLRLFTRENDVVLDPFCGSGVICRVAAKLRRRCICIDIRETTYDDTMLADSVSLPLRSGAVDAVVTSPPYYRGVKYSGRSLFESDSIDDYVDGIKLFARECRRVLKPGGTVLIRVGDTYDRGELIPIHVYWLEEFVARGFSLKHIIVYVYWDSAYVEGNVRKMHDYILVFTYSYSEPGN